MQRYLSVSILITSSCIAIGLLLIAINLNLIPLSSQSHKISPTTSQIVDTSTWKTYRNDKYGFEFRYPSSWTMEAVRNEQEIAVFTAPHASGNLGKTYDSITVSTYPMPPGYESKPTVLFAGKGAVRDAMNLGLPGGLVEYIYIVDAPRLTIGVSLGDNSDVNQILSTFKFIK